MFCIVTTSLALLGFFLNTLSSSEACMCMPVHPQTAFCRSDFAIKATVISERKVKRIKGSEVLEKLGFPVPLFIHYDVEVNKVYKGFSKIANATSVHDTFHVPVHTSQSGALCGVSLTKHMKYLIMGTIIGDRLQINHCNYLKEFHLITKEIKHGLHGNYDCDCLVSACVDGYCDIKGGCPWNIHWAEPADECTAKHRFCRKSERRNTNKSKPKCEWTEETSEYNRCKKTTIMESFFP